MGPVAGSKEWCQQGAVIVVTASESEKAIGIVRCLPCDVGLMLMVRARKYGQAGVLRSVGAETEVARCVITCEYTMEGLERARKSRSISMGVVGCQAASLLISIKRQC